MGLGRYLLGCAELAAMILPLAWAARRLRHRAWSSLTGATAALADVVVVLAGLLLVAQVLGTVGALRGGWMVLGCVLAGAAAGGLAGRPASGEAGDRRRARPGATVAAAAGLVAFGQTAATLTALRGGMFDFDTVNYHLPIAARWVQEGWLTGIHHIFPGSLFGYYPANSELLHALGMLAFGRDVLSPVLGLLAVVLLLLAAWCIGAARGAGPAAVAGAAVLPATAMGTQIGGGTAFNDLPALALLLAAFAFVMAAPTGAGRGPLLLAGAAAGLAVGMKTVMLVPVFVLVVGVLVLARRHFLVFAAAGVVCGGYWYVRNLLVVGTPIPGGPLGGPQEANTAGTSFAETLSRESAGALRAALDSNLGSLWPLIVLAVAAGLLVAAIRPRDGWERVAALAGLAAAAVWAFIPYTAFALFTIRYASAAIVLGAILLAVRVTPWAFVGLATVAAVEVVGLDRGYVAASVVAAAAVAALVALWPAGRLPVAALAVMVVAAGAPLADRFLDGRYVPGEVAFPQNAQNAEPLAGWARSLRGERIGVDGVHVQYPLFGTDLSNQVQHVGTERPDGGFARTSTCAEWRRAVNAGRYAYLVLEPYATLFAPRPVPSGHAGWTASDPAARLIHRFPGGVTVYALDGPMDPAAC